MILDSSSVIGTLRRERDYLRLQAALEGAAVISIGAPTLFETGIVAIGRFGRRGIRLVDGFLDEWEVDVLPFDQRHWLVAADAFARYGKGRRHPARLNYGDCMTYATARLARRPLLFTGEDFARTDLAVA